MDGQLLYLGSNKNEVLGVEWTIVVCQPFGPLRPCLKSLCSTLAVRSATEAHNNDNDNNVGKRYVTRQ